MLDKVEVEGAEADKVVEEEAVKAVEYRLGRHSSHHKAWSLAAPLVRFRRQALVRQWTSQVGQYRLHQRPSE